MEIEKVGVNMFEKDEEEILNNYCDCELLPECISGIRCRCSDFEEMKKLLLEGIEFGYNKAKEEVEDSYRESLCNSELNLASVTEQLEELEKANEWHYVKDGDLPNTETKNYTYIRRRKRYERQFTDYRVIKCFVLCQNEKGKITAEVGYFDCNQKCFFDKAEGIVIAWKEIVLPELEG